MSVIYILLIASLIVALTFLVGFIWAVRNGQFDDKFTPSLRILWDNKEKKIKDDSKNRDEEK